MLENGYHTCKISLQLIGLSIFRNNMVHCLEPHKSKLYHTGLYLQKHFRLAGPPKVEILQSFPEKTCIIWPDETGIGRVIREVWQCKQSVGVRLAELRV